MGVMGCSINNCHNILCDTYVDDVGYICNDYQSTFKDSLKVHHTHLEGDKEIIRYLKIFANGFVKPTPPLEPLKDFVTPFFEKHTR